MNIPKNKNTQAWFLLIILSVIWGSTFILIKLGLKAFSPVQTAALRIFLTGLFLLPFSINNISKVPKKLWLYIFVAAGIGNGIPPFLLTKAQTVINSATAGILNSLTPIFTLTLGFIFFRMKITWHKILGIVIGFGGAGMIIFSSSNGNFNLNFFTTIVLLAGICYALSTNLIKKYLQKVSPLHLTSVGFLFLMPFAGGVLLKNNILQVFYDNQEQAISSFLYILILALAGTALANILFYKLIQMSNPLFAQSFTYLVPVTATTWGILSGEKITLFEMFGIILIMSGVYLINFTFVKRHKD